MTKESRWTLRSCRCQICQQQPQSAVGKKHRAINQLVATLDEKSRRLVVGFWASQQGRGGIARLARITGLSRNTLRRGQRELAESPGVSRLRVRQAGGGRQRIEKKA
jgi:DNA-binding phage protein